MSNLADAIEEFSGFEHIEGLKLLEFTEELPATPGEFVTNFLTYPGYNQKYSTIYPDGKILTNLNRTRSAQEIFDVTKTYYPNLTIEEYFNILVEVAELFKKEKMCICMSYCNTIRRHTIFKYSMVGNGFRMGKNNNISIWPYLLEPGARNSKFATFLSTIDANNLNKNAGVIQLAE